MRYGGNRQISQGTGGFAASGIPRYLSGASKVRIALRTEGPYQGSRNDCNSKVDQDAFTIALGKLVKQQALTLN